jgi:hypothetical protein
MLRIPRHALRTLSLFTLLCPTAAFLLTWVRPVFSVPSVLALGGALFFYARRGAQARLHREEDVWQCPALLFFAALACAMLWTQLSGIGGFFYQNEDHYGRNAIFHDLLNHSWPVYFEGTPYALTYYINYWILPSLLGKAAALLDARLLWPAANIALYVQTVWFLLLTFLLLFSVLNVKRLWEALLVLFLFVFFSGMDTLLIAHDNAWNIQAEWWAELYQYSSHTTCLFWVYNQAVPAWLGVMLLLSRKEDVSSYALLGLSVLPFSPLPFVGLFVYFLLLALAALVHRARMQGLRAGVTAFAGECFSAQNLLAILAILPSFYFYFSANQASSQAPFRLELFTYAFTPMTIFLRLLLFALVEFGAFALVLGSRYRKEPLFLFTCVLLLLCPLFRVGFNGDFSMRASIPGLTVLCVYAQRFLLEALHEKRRRYAAGVLALLLSVGAFTPLLEFERGAYKVRQAGTLFLSSDPFGTVLHPQADTFNFICEDVNTSVFYRYFAMKGANPP